MKWRVISRVPGSRQDPVSWDRDKNQWESKLLSCMLMVLRISQKWKIFWWDSRTSPSSHSWDAHLLKNSRKLLRFRTKKASRFQFLKSAVTFQSVSPRLNWTFLKCSNNLTKIKVDLLGVVHYSFISEIQFEMSSSSPALINELIMSVFTTPFPLLQ